MATDPKEGKKLILTSGIPIRYIDEIDGITKDVPAPTDHCNGSIRTCGSVSADIAEKTA